jgi:uncharacterized protein YijF (DUF1287 family)
MQFIKNLFKQRRFRIALILLIGTLCIIAVNYSSFTKIGFVRQFQATYPAVTAPPSPATPTAQKTFFDQLAVCAEQRTKVHVVYDGSYQKIGYPGGDVDPNKGVCTDVVIRSYRALGIDLQERLHNDIRDNFLKYPKIWRLTKPDTNIDHRRVPNLMVFFKRKGQTLPITDNPADYSPGDIVIWDLNAGLTHIGIVSTQTSPKTGNPLIVHNIGSGPVLNDMLFRATIIGHFRYEPMTAPSQE